jgi:hypothetical protein
MEFAKIYMRMAAEAKAIYGSLPGTVWYGGEWGFRHYMEEAGFKLIDSRIGSPPVRGGDLILLPAMASPYRLAQDLESMLVEVKRHHYRPESPLRLLDQVSHAGFHSVFWGLLPFSFSSADLETLKVYQVSLLSEKLPDARCLPSGPPLPRPMPIEEAGERKLGLVGGVPMRISYSMPLPRNGKMIFGIKSFDAADPVEFTVRITPEGGDAATVFSRTAADTRPGQRFTVDLAAFPPGVAEVDLETVARGELKPGARAAWIDFCLIP